MKEFRPTRHGLLRTEFRDRFGALCSAQESSCIEEDCLWLGVEVGPLSDEEVPAGRMHLTKDLALELIHVLRHFALTGKLGRGDAERPLFYPGRYVRGVAEENLGIEGRIISITEDDVDFKVIVIEELRSKPALHHYIVFDRALLYWEPFDPAPPPEPVSHFDHIVSEDE